MKRNQSWDIIGDIHGYADELRVLLEAMGYEKCSGTYFHPLGRKVLFLGDYIDRGLQIRETLQIVRKMVEAGRAQAIMGNHEFNALAYATPDGRGGWLREHKPEKIEQHAQTQKQIAVPYPEEWQDWLQWFASLPLFLELDGLRAVHAAWCDESVAAFAEIGHLDSSVLSEIMDKGGSLYAKRETLLNGIELDLPPGHYFLDKSGFKRRQIRVRWWEKLGSEGARTYRQAVFPDSDTVPDFVISSGYAGLTGYPAEAPPVFFGHYWLPADRSPAPLKPNVACLDYSVAKGGNLTAYRWDGEQTIKSEKFVTAGTVSARI